MPSLNTPVKRLKVAILPLDSPCSGPVTHSGEILTTGKSNGQSKCALKFLSVLPAVCVLLRSEQLDDTCHSHTLVELLVAELHLCTAVNT